MDPTTDASTQLASAHAAIELRSQRLAGLPGELAERRLLDRLADVIDRAKRMTEPGAGPAYRREHAAALVDAALSVELHTLEDVAGDFAAEVLVEEGYGEATATLRRIRTITGEIAAGPPTVRSVEDLEVRTANLGRWTASMRALAEDAAGGAS